MQLPPLRLAHKIILSLIAVTAVTGFLAGYVHVRAQESQLIAVMIRSADQLSQAITSAVWDAMLANDREALHQHVRSAAAMNGIDRVRVFNKEGRVMFAAGDSATAAADHSPRPCRLCHASDQTLERLDASSRAQIFRGADGRRRLIMATPIYNEPACGQAPCHAHPPSLKVLGVLDVTMSLGEVDHQLGRLQLTVFLITLMHAVLMSAIIVYLIRRLVDQPMKSLIHATRDLAVTNLDHPIEVKSSGELDELARSFDTVRGQLAHAVSLLNDFADSLEKKVEERTAELEVAHRKLLQTDRLASLGQLAASVAHEINNPVAGVLTLSMLMDRIVGDKGIPPERLGEFKRYLGQVTSETARVGRIVSDLLAFSRRSQPRRAGTDLNGLVTQTLAVLSHKLKLANVSVELHLDEGLPGIQCDGSQIQQVILNLVMNGAEATAGRGRGQVPVSTRRGQGETVILEVADDGDGIPPAVLPRIFDPFYTTKDEGKGVGLGLAVVYGILEAHGGEIDVRTQVGEGTTFTVTLPWSGAPAEAAEAP